MADQTIRLTAGSSPHVKSPETIRSVMADVVVAMIPILIAATVIFGLRVLMVTAFSVAFCVLIELIIAKGFGLPVRVGDFSAVVTGMLLAFVLPPGIPLWIVFIGALVAIGIAKMPYGGVGNNLFNPALIGRAFLLASWPASMTSWTIPDKLGAGKFALFTNYASDAVTGATPLAIVKEGGFVYDFAKTPMADLFFGNIGGCIGETSVIAILIGAAYLFYKGQITWHIPIPYVLTVFGLTFVHAGVKSAAGTPVFFQVLPAFFHILAGGLMLGAFFMATDMVTSPVTPRGRIIFGIGCGLIVYMIRLFGAYPEGVCYSILVMNAFTPLIDRWTRPRIFGEVVKAA